MQSTFPTELGCSFHVQAFIIAELLRNDWQRSNLIGVSSIPDF